MFLTRVAIIIIAGGYALGVQAKVPIDKVLFYVGRHIHTDRVVIWGQTALSEEMVKILLEKNPSSVGQMEALLRSTGNRWSGNYKNYQLHDFFVSKAGQTDKIFTDVVRGSQEFQLLDGYVDRVEEVDDGERFLDAKGEAVLPVEKINGGITECAVASGSACSLLTESFNDFDKLVLTEIEKQILAYFEEYREALKGNGIVIGEMAEALGISSGESLGQMIRSLKKKLDEGHFIQRIGSKQLKVDGKLVTFYRFKGADIFLTPSEEGVLAYFAKHMEALEDNGIVVGEMAEALEIKSGGSLGKRITSLKKKLDEEHFIQRIGSERRSVDRKNVYRFANDIVVFTPEVEKQILAYFEAHMEALEGNGIVIGEMAEALGIKSGGSLGKRITSLKKKLDEEHFIQRIGSEKRRGDRKLVYRFVDAVDIVVLTSEEERILAYFAKHMEALEGNGIVLGEMAEALGIKSGGSLGKRITSLKKKLDEEHFIQRIGSKRRRGDRKLVYRFVDAVDIVVLTSEEERVLAYFEVKAHMEALEGYGIVLGEMAKALGIKSRSLGMIITSLKKKLDEEHFIQRIGSKRRRGDRKLVYRFVDAVDIVVLTSEEERVLAYFEVKAHMEALEGYGIVLGEMAKALGIKSRSLGKRITSLKKKLDEEHFIQRIGSEKRRGDRKLVYRFVDAVDIVVLTSEEERILAYFAKHMEALEGNGIVIGEMAEALGIKSGGSLGKRITSLKKKLDEEHFIQRIGSKSRSVDGKMITFYRFADAVEQLQIGLQGGR